MAVHVRMVGLSNNGVGNRFIALNGVQGINPRFELPRVPTVLLLSATKPEPVVTSVSSNTRLSTTKPAFRRLAPMRRRSNDLIARV